jgi:D-ribose pyranase
MKKTTLLQSDLSYTIATLGHLDTLVIADAGLPIPAETVRIDLALTQGVPGAIQTLKVVLEEMEVEKVILAEEAKDRNPQFLRDVQELLPGVPVQFVTHLEFKTRTASARAVADRRIFSLCQCDSRIRSCFLKWIGLLPNQVSKEKS